MATRRNAEIFVSTGVDVNQHGTNPNSLLLDLRTVLQSIDSGRLKTRKAILKALADVDFTELQEERDQEIDKAIAGIHERLSALDNLSPRAKKSPKGLELARRWREFFENYMEGSLQRRYVRFERELYGNGLRHEDIGISKKEWFELARLRKIGEAKIYLEAIRSGTSAERSGRTPKWSPQKKQERRYNELVHLLNSAKSIATEITLEELGMSPEEMACYEEAKKCLTYTKIQYGKGDGISGKGL